MDTTTPIRRIAPLYKPLGVYRHTGYPRYIIEVAGEVRCYRGADLPCLAFLLDVYPDAGHWRRLFPRMSSKIDSKAAAAWFMRECQKLGHYELAAAMKPRPVGRPPNSHSKIIQ